MNKIRHLLLARFSHQNSITMVNLFITTTFYLKIVLNGLSSTFPFNFLRKPCIYTHLHPLITTFREKTGLGVLLIVLIAGCTGSSVLYKETGNRRLVSKINAVIRHSGLKPNLGIKVISLRTGETLYSLNSNHLFNPASNNKIYTAAAALKFLSPQYQFETSVWIDSLIPEQNSVNRLTLKGTGDPNLSLQELEKIAVEVSKTVSQVDTVVLDASAFDNIPYGPGWMWDEGSQWYFAQVSALTVNDNCVDIAIRPGKVGNPPIVEITPPTNYVTIQNTAITVEDTSGFRELNVERHWWDRSNIIDITGNILSSEKNISVWCNIENPALFTGQVFTEYLQDTGVKITGPTILDTLRNPNFQLVRHTSNPLTTTILNFLKISDNLTGELLVKSIGRNQTGKQGTWNNGLLTIKTFLNNEVGIDTTQLRMVDGSGVSRYNLTTPGQLIQALSYLYNDYTLNAEFLAALPTGGWDGTLKNRLRSKEINRKIRAKTGTLAGVSCLSGYAFTKGNEPLAFSIMMNGYVGDADLYRKLQDDICTVLVSYSR